MAKPKHLEVFQQGANAIHAFRLKYPRTKLDLSDADLSGTKLAGANLNNADLRRTNLTRVDLSESDLRRANLSGANLSRANLRNTNLSYSVLSATVFSCVDLSETQGLDRVNHNGPSTIGVDTLFRSHGKIPEIFLRGCGVPEEFINYVPSFFGVAIEFYSCFISYSHADKQFARQLHDRLQGKGIRCWLDEKHLNPGDDLYHEIDRGIRIWDKVLLCASQNSLTSGWVDDEITIALEKEKELLRSTEQKLLKIIPLDLDGFMFSEDWQSGYRAQIRKRVAADFTRWKADADEFDLQFERVVKALRTDGGKLPEPIPKLPK